VSPRLVGGALAVLFCLGLGVYGWRGVVRLQHMRGQLEALERDNAALREQATRLTRTIDRLRNDPDYLEQIAREEQGMVRPGDTILKFPARDKAPDR
jgi:cell division protein FtsB